MKKGGHFGSYRRDFFLAGITQRPVLQEKGPPQGRGSYYAAAAFCFASSCCFCPLLPLWAPLVARLRSYITRIAYTHHSATVFAVICGMCCTECSGLYCASSSLFFIRLRCLPSILRKGSQFDEP